MNITRREFAIGTGTLALTGAAVLAGFTSLGWPRPALAQDPSPAELMKAGPLGEMVLGDEKAPVTVIEYASMTCPHCANFHEVTYPEMKKRYIDTGKIRFIFREFPLDQLAAAGFMLARCSAQDVKSPVTGLDQEVGALDEGLESKQAQPREFHAVMILGAGEGCRHRQAISLATLSPRGEANCKRLAPKVWVE